MAGKSVVVVGNSKPASRFWNSEAIIFHDLTLAVPLFYGWSSLTINIGRLFTSSYESSMFPSGSEKRRLLPISTNRAKKGVTASIVHSSS